MHPIAENKLLFCVIFGALLKCGSSAPDFSKVSSGEQVLIIATTDASLPETQTAIEVYDPSESWEVDNNDLSIRRNDEKITPEHNVVPTTLKPKMPTKPEIYSFRIQSDIKYRYSSTHVTSRVANRDSEKSQEVTFRVVLPETAFISKFIMEIDGKQYEAYVKEKEEAKRVYSQAQSQGQSAGLVEVSTRNSDTFNVNVNIKAQSKVTFNLTYEELLSRRLGKYEQSINISPEQVSSVKDFQIVVNIEESQNITYLRVPNLRNDVETESDAEGNNKDAVVNRTGNKANILWSPSVADQEKLSKQGIGGKFVVQYDINRESTSGEVLVMEGYFVHFFAPENLKPLRKHVVFVLDVSGSMWGRKMEQLKDSQKKILDDLNSDDFFNIITFSGDVFLWAPSDPIANQESSNDWYPASYFNANSKRTDIRKQQPYPATTENIEKAKQFIDSLIASGGTNIHDSIISAISLTSAIKAASNGIEKLPTPQPVVQTESPEKSMVEVVTVNSSSAEVVTEVVTLTSSTVRPTKPTELDVKNLLPKNVESLILFLTDGEPTVGVTDPPLIQELIQTANKNLTLPIFSLGFGEGADFPFLRKLSLQNYGFARKIYEASDAALQLKGFYNEIASPLLAHVLFNYTSPEYNITEVTVTSFPTVFGGTEIAVAGKLTPLPHTQDATESVGVEETTEVVTTVLPVDSGIVFDAPADGSLILSEKQFLHVGITGNGREGPVVFRPPPIFCQPIDFEGINRPFPPRPTPPPTPEDNFMERLWAYLTIKQLIEKDLRDSSSKSNEILQDHTPDSSSSTNPSSTASTVHLNVTKESKPETSKEQAVRLALKYGFVTPFTSLVVVKPNSSDVTDTKPAGTPEDVPDSLSAPQSMNYFAVVQPQPLSLSTKSKFGSYSNKMPIANRISPGSPGVNWIQSQAPMKRPDYVSQTRPMGIQFAFSTTRRPSPTLFSVLSTTTTINNQVEFETQSYEGMGSVENLDTDTTTDRGLTLVDLKWFNSSNPTLHLNTTHYNIFRNDTGGADCATNEGYDCSVSEAGTGQCVHLKDCIKQAFVTDLQVFTNFYFCPIQSTSGSGDYVGVCCSSALPGTTSTPIAIP